MKNVLIVLCLIMMPIIAIAESDPNIVSSELKLLRSNNARLRAENKALKEEIAILKQQLASVKTSQPDQPDRLASTNTTQDKRKAFIEKLISEGIFKKVEVVGNTPHVWVDSIFMALEFEAKQTFISVVAAYYYSTGTDSVSLVQIKNNLTGKQIGSFSQFSGLQMK